MKEQAPFLASMPFGLMRIACVTVLLLTLGACGPSGGEGNDPGSTSGSSSGSGAAAQIKVLVVGGRLWRTDGTAAGTVPVQDGNTGAVSFPYGITEFNGAFYFQANDGVSGFELWKTDGTAAGTVFVKDINTAAGAGSFPADFTVFNDALYFAADDGASRRKLWRSDLTTDFAWCFVTGGTADNTAPGVTSTIPANAVTGAAINRKITATFSKEMNSSTLTAASFTLTGPGATPVFGAVTYLGGTAVFTPTNGLASNTTYTATITAGARDLAGNASQPKAWSFTTGANADATAPVAVMPTYPAGGASNVPIGSTISVTLSEPMDPATLITANFGVTGLATPQ